MLEAGKENKSIVFSWREEEFDQLLRTCLLDDGVQVSLQYLTNHTMNILEAGCGAGRVVKYLHDLGFSNVSGIEINHDAVLFLNKKYPELNVVVGDILSMPYQKYSFDVILCYGVIEHFSAGPEAVLWALSDILKSDGIAVITVPSFNIIRRISYLVSLCDIRKFNWLRKLFKKPLLIRNGSFMELYIEPQFGAFFEYRFTKKQFESYLKKAGFDIIESRPIAHIDGLFHSFARRCVQFEKWEFKVGLMGKVINRIFSLIPFFHNHMHLCVVKKQKKID